jgi:hypothetical protein
MSPLCSLLTELVAAATIACTPVPPGSLPDSYSAVFDSSTNTYVSVPSPDSPTTGLGVSFWMKSSDLNDAASLVVKWNNSGTHTWRILANYAVTGALLGQFSSGGVGTNLISVVNVLNGNWHHIVMTWDSATTTARFYIDGAADTVPQFSAPATLDASTNPIILGGYYDTAPISQYTGKLDQVLTFNYALTQADVTALYNGGVPPANTSSLSSFANALLWLPIGEGRDTSHMLYDLKGLNNATVSGPLTFSTDVP